MKKKISITSYSKEERKKKKSYIDLHIYYEGIRFYTIENFSFFYFLFFSSFSVGFLLINMGVCLSVSTYCLKLS